MVGEYGKHFFDARLLQQGKEPVEPVIVHLHLVRKLDRLSEEDGREDPQGIAQVRYPEPEEVNEPAGGDPIGIGNVKDSDPAFDEASGEFGEQPFAPPDPQMLQHNEGMHQFESLSVQTVKPVVSHPESHIPDAVFPAVSGCLFQHGR